MGAGQFDPGRQEDRLGSRTAPCRSSYFAHQGPSPRAQLGRPVTAIIAGSAESSGPEWFKRRSRELHAHSATRKGRDLHPSSKPLF
jgi:hypothetical protein